MPKEPYRRHRRQLATKDGDERAIELQVPPIDSNVRSAEVKPNLPWLIELLARPSRIGPCLTGTVPLRLDRNPDLHSSHAGVRIEFRRVSF